VRTYASEEPLSPHVRTGQPIPQAADALNGQPLKIC